MPMPDQHESIEKTPLVFYSVIYCKYDNRSELHGKLYHVRHACLAEDIYGRRVIEDVCNGVDTRWVYHITKKGLKWKKVKGRKTVQRTVAETAGYGVITIGDDGSIVSKTVFDDTHQWIYSYYYMNDNMVRPYIIIEPIKGENAIHFLEYDKTCRKYSKNKLYACPITPGTVVQSMVNNELGEPEICAATSEGDFYYCSETECNRRLSLAQQICEEEDGAIPKWNGADANGISRQEPDFNPIIDLSKYQFNFTPKQMGADELNPILNDAPPEQETQIGDNGANNNQPFVDFEMLLHADLPDEEIEALEKSNELALEESKRKLQLAKCGTTDVKDVVRLEQPRHSSAYCSNRELYCAEDTCKPFINQPQTDTKHTPLQVENIIAQVERMIGKESNAYKQSSPIDMPKKKAETASEENGSENCRCTDAVQKENGSTSCSQEILDNIISKHEISAAKSVSASKRIVVNEAESYLYFGRLIDGLRQGRGRTEMEHGYTAYDGYYRNDKRDGFGAYYYKSGQICYVGDWKENKRDGVGVSYTPGGENFHVGRWNQDKPVGTGAIFDRDGNLSFAGKIENGLRQGVGISYQAEDGAIFVGKWKDNVLTGKGSAFDGDGNLIYTGMWKEGKRHGFGTEYNKDGTIVFTGEWENDQYLDGVLYHKVEHNDSTKPEIDV